jgi:4-amino-4-deoxy-L-arabinose transferase-like glycosyltransferase
MSQTLLSDDLYQPDFPSLGLFSTWFGVALIGLTAVLQANASSRGGYWAQPLVEGMKFVLVALILASLFYLPFRAERGIKWAALPLMINVGTLIIVQLVPFATLWEAARFRWRMSHYEVVVQLLETGELVPGESGTVLLPEAYRYLSADNGRIAVETNGETTAIFFFTERNAPRNFAGYLYRSDSNPPQQGDFLGRWRHVVQKQANWYFCISE